jgi:hypothetical protein
MIKSSAEVFIKRAKCYLFGHHLKTVQVFSRYARRVQCVDCGGDWVRHTVHLGLVAWDAEFEKMYREFGYRIIDPKFSNGEPLHIWAQTRINVVIEPFDKEE